jgi:hypothetical protein
MSFWAPSIDKGALRSLRNRKRLCSPFWRISCRIKRNEVRRLEARGCPRAVLEPDVYRGGLEVELLDCEGDQLGDPQGMAECQKDKQLVWHGVAVPTGSLAKRLHLGLG